MRAAARAGVPSPPLTAAAPVVGEGAGLQTHSAASWAARSSRSAPAAEPAAMASPLRPPPRQRCPAVPDLRGPASEHLRHHSAVVATVRSFGSTAATSTRLVSGSSMSLPHLSPVVDVQFSVSTTKFSSLLLHGAGPATCELWLQNKPPPGVQGESPSMDWQAPVPVAAAATAAPAAAARAAAAAASPATVASAAAQTCAGR